MPFAAIGIVKYQHASEAMQATCEVNEVSSAGGDQNEKLYQFINSQLKNRFRASQSPAD